MSFPVGPQPQQTPQVMSELCLRLPDNVGVHAQVSYEQAMVLLTQAVEMAQRVPFAWSYIDKPQDGQAYLIFIFPTAQTTMPPDGIRWLDQEKTYRLPVHNGRELEVAEVKYGFVPGAEMSASRVRRRFRLSKGGNPQLMLIHYLRGDSISIPQHLINVPIRSYPLRPTNEPRLFVAGERMGQRVAPSGPSALPTLPATHLPHVPQPNGVGINMGLGLGIGGMSQVAALAQQNQAMDALERDRRNRAMGSSAAMPRPDEEDSGDEYENVTTRSLAIERFKRNHLLMAEVFQCASQSSRKIPPRPAPYESLNLDQMNQQIEKLQPEIVALRTRAEDRRLAQEAAEASAEAEQRQGADVAPISV